VIAEPNTVPLDYVSTLSPHARHAFYMNKAAHYQKLARDACNDSVRNTLDAVAREFVSRARAAHADR
jgi:hypothetical protein